MNKQFSIIVAIDENNGIGKNNDLLTYIPSDLKRFKEITSGHAVIMGRKTWESLPVKPLPKRLNIVISSANLILPDGAVSVGSIEQAISVSPEGEEIFIMGGASIYKQFLPLVGKIYLTKIHHQFEADTYFPSININDWKENFTQRINDDPKSNFAYSFINLERIVSVKPINYTK